MHIKHVLLNVQSLQMLEQFFATMRVAWIACQISARYRLKPPKVLAYHHPLEQCLFDCLTSSKSGVFVHWGVYESGKSTAARQAAWRLQEEEGRQVIGFSGFEFSWLKPPEKRLRHAIGVPEDTNKALSEFFMQDTTIIIDHFDTFMRDKDYSAAPTLEMVRELIKESEATQNFNVLLVVTSWERAKELVDAGCKLIPPARWTSEQLETLYATLPDKVTSEMGERQSELLRLSTLSGTPGFLTYEAISDRKRFSMSHAAMHDLEWRRGMKALCKQAHDLDLSPHVQVGRFPDRNGVYHHEDLAYTPALSTKHQTL
jgi:hypothetical protein